MIKRYVWIDVKWRGGRRCQYVKRTAARISRAEYVGEVLAVKYGH